MVGDVGSPTSPSNREFRPHIVRGRWLVRLVGSLLLAREVRGGRSPVPLVTVVRILQAWTAIGGT